MQAGGLKLGGGLQLGSTQPGQSTAGLQLGQQTTAGLAGGLNLGGGGGLQLGQSPATSGLQIGQSAGGLKLGGAATTGGGLQTGLGQTGGLGGLQLGQAGMTGGLQLGGLSAQTSKPGGGPQLGQAGGPQLPTYSAATQPTSAAATGGLQLGGLGAQAKPTGGLQLGGVTAQTTTSGVVTGQAGGLQLGAPKPQVTAGLGGGKPGGGLQLGGLTAASTTAGAPTLGGLVTSQTKPGSLGTPNIGGLKTGAGLKTATAAPPPAAASSKKYTYKELESLVNKWSLELQAQEKLFVQQASQVNKWDSMLAENGDKIVELNSEVERVKTEQERVDNELDLIQAQQKELDELLTQLESRVDNAPTHGGLHADMQRTKTFQAAENIDSQLKQMSQDLKMIIEQMNESNTPSDEENPFTQIVCILNAHTDSLGWIDHEAALLRKKVDDVAKVTDYHRQEQELSFRKLGCGPGEQSRIINCVDAQGNIVDPRSSLYPVCFAQPQPPNVQPCYVPCPEDCVVSDWTSWSACTHSCGQDHGTQTRTRQLVVIGNSCPYNESDFTETRTCTVPAPCEPPSYHVEVGEWSECREGVIGSGDTPDLIQIDAGTRMCEQGIRNRTLYCMLEGRVVPAEDCPIDIAVSETESCDLSCDQECIFSAWSEYSQCSCEEGMKTRMRHLIQLPDDPQRECGVDEYGQEVEMVTCVPSDCVEQVYQWVGDNWSDCVLFATTPPCGYGYQTTPLACTDVTDGGRVGDELCRDLPHPLSSRSCVIPCPNRCVLTEWSDFTPCYNGQQNRSRDIIPFAGSASWTDSCSHLFNLSLEETIDCTDSRLDQYGYSTISFYSALIIESPDPTVVCGNGFKYRSVGCVNMFGDPNVFYDVEFCSHAEPENTETLASVKCNIDCVQNQWSEWTPCSASCGYGIRTRTRSTIIRPQTGGRPCGADHEVDVCYTQDCRYTEYTPGPFSICQVSNTSAICGPGNHTREPLCTVNGLLQETTAECELRGAELTFELSEACTMPCPGACVVSEWEEWSKCPTNCLPGVTCQQSRHRMVIRDGDDCPSTQEFQVCTPEDDIFAWTVSSWGNCTLGSVVMETTAGSYCGDGVQRGIVECVDMTNGEVMYDAQCTRPKPEDIRQCSIPCPTDCVLGPFSDWSECPQRCERGLMQYRNRSIVSHSAHGGRQCPEILTEQRSCPPSNCTVYVIEESRDSLCELDLTLTSQCGSGQVSKALSCRRNTQFMELDMCLEAMEQGLNVIGAEYLTSEACSDDIDCPLEPACTYTEWSEWSNCTSTCVDVNGRFSYRTRALILSHQDSTEECHSMQYETQECMEPENSTDLIPFQSSSSCVGFQWTSSDFASDGTRTVQCVTDSGLPVSGGCPVQTMPSVTRQSCDLTKCPTYSECAGDSCVCRDGFERVQNQCLPLSDCANNTHCLYSQMVCERGQCVCKENFHYRDGRCMYIGPPTEPTQVTTATDEPDTNVSMTTDDITTSSTSTTGTATELGILPIVLIATVPLVVVIFVVVLLIVIMWRCRKSLDKKHKTDSLKRRGQVKISAPSPVHSLDQYGHYRGADSASSGFVEDLEHDQYKYGMAGRTFVGSQKTMPSSREDIDEAAFVAEFPAQAPPSPHIHPIPVAVPRLPGYQLEHIALDYRPGAPTDIPDGDFTTDITYTTDEGSFMTTSVPPSSHGSPNVARRHAHLPAEEHSQATENTYVPMHPVYTKVTPRSQRHAHNESHDWERRSHDRDRLHSTGSHDRSRDYRDRLQSNGSYDYREYRDVSHDYRGRSHDHMDQRERSRSAGRENYRVYEHERERYYNRRDQRSPSPGSGQYYRDRGIATGLDNSLVQAISQMEGGVTTPAHSVRSAGGSRGSRRRRRRYQGQPHHMTYHQQYRYNSDGPSDHELTSASEAEQSYHHSRRMPSRSLPISPVRSDPDEPDYDALPPPHIQVKPATPTNRRVESPDHVPQSRVDQLKTSKLRGGHYDYPRCFYNSPPSSQEVSHSPPLTPSQPVSLPTQSTSLSPPAHIPTPSTRYEHLTPLKISPREGSPISACKHPPSPLALHAEGVVTPRSSGEVMTFQPSQ